MVDVNTQGACMVKHECTACEIQLLIIAYAKEKACCEECTATLYRVKEDNEEKNEDAMMMLDLATSYAQTG